MTKEERAVEFKNDLISEGMNPDIADYCKQAFVCGCFSQQVWDIANACECIEQSLRIIGLETHADWLKVRLRKAMEGDAK